MTSLIVEAWRGWAALMVVWAHWAAPTGLQWSLGKFAFTGVDLFFVISGFVFAPTILGNPINWRAFAVRRFFRMFPAYWLSLAVYIAMAWYSGKPLDYVGEHVFMLHLQSKQMAFHYNPVFWSLPSELEFYMLIPLLVLLVRQRMARILTLLIVALALRLVLISPADGDGQNWAFLWLHHLPGLLVEFFVGVVVWQLRGINVRLGWRLLIGASGVLGWFALAAIFNAWEATNAGWKNGQLGLGAALLFALTLWSTSYADPPRTPAAQAACAWAGKLSYAVYLLHMAWLGPTLYLVQTCGRPLGILLGLVGLLSSALLLHYFVENPARNWGRVIAARL